MTDPNEITDPTEITDRDWIRVWNNTERNNRRPVNNGSGYFLIFRNHLNPSEFPMTDINNLWEKVAHLTKSGHLGYASVVCTARRNEEFRESRGTDSEPYVICVRTYDYKDENDRSRVLQALRTWRIVGEQEYVEYRADK